MAQPSWHQVRIYYYDTNKDGLLLDCIRPLMVTLQERGRVERAYFTRHWQGGSHVRLNLFAESNIFEREVFGHVEDEVGAYLKKYPSSGGFSEEDALRQYKRRSNLTFESLVYMAPVPNNTLLVAPYGSLVPVVGSEGAARLLEDYYVETNDLVFTIIEETRNDYTARFNACFDQLVALVAAASLLPLSKAYMSYRSHVEAYIVCEPELEDPTRRRQRLQESYAERCGAVKQRVKRLLQLIELAPERLPGWLTEVIAVHRRYAERAIQGVEDGTIRLKDLEDTDQPRPFRLGASDFHAAVASNRAMRELDRLPIMVADRLVLNLLYLHLSRTGMINEDRYILDYYIAEAIEDLFHISPVDVVRNFHGLAS